MEKQTSKLVFSTRADAELNKAKTPSTVSLPPQQQSIVVRLEKKGRGGKVVTVAAGFKLSASELKLLEKLLKQHCGAGGTCKEDAIEIQGDHRDKLVEKLIQLAYKAKRSGG